MILDGIHNLGLSKLNQNDTKDLVKRSSSLASNPKDSQDKKLYGACVDFEAIFIKQMLNSMKKNIGKTGLLDGGMAEDIFEDMLYDEYAQKMAETARFGLARLLYNEFTE